MNTTKVAVCDLTHTAQTISSEFMPYAQGCIATYLKAHCAHPVEVEVFKFMEELEDKIKTDCPDIIGFSFYMWNSDLSLKVAKIIKQKHPNIITVFGGPNFSVEIEKQKEWLQMNRQADFFIPFEGEIAFCNLVTSIIENNKDLDKVRRSGIKSTCSYDGESFFIYPLEERIKNLEEIPSPYLEGYFDKFFDTPLWFMYETNRGCGFKCSFCNQAYSYFNRTSFKDINTIKAEFQYMAKNHRKNSMVYMADSNFLMFPRDLEICNILKETMNEYNFPTFVGCTTGKNKKENVLKGAHLLSGKITIAASVQSLDQEVLKNIDRTNISHEELVSLARDVKNTDGISYSELIACLPGDTLKSYFESMRKLVESEISMIKLHVLILVEGAPLNVTEQRKKYGFRAMFRPVTKSFGYYEFLGSKFTSIEFEEVVIETNALPYSDYLLCRKLNLVIHSFYNDFLFEEVHKILKIFDIPVWDWLYSIYNSLDTLENNSIKNFYEDYIAEVKDELWASREELINDLNYYMEEFLSAKRGNNITFKYKALLLKERKYLRDAFELGFSQMKKILRENNIDVGQYHDFFAQLKQFCILRKQDIFSIDRDTKQTFDYDFSRLNKSEVSSEIFSKIEKEYIIEVFHSDHQKEFIEEYFKNRSRDKIWDFTTLMNRVPAKTMYRDVTVRTNNIKHQMPLVSKSIALSPQAEGKVS